MARINELYISEQARMSAGREFQIVGAATRKLRVPKFSLHVMMMMMMIQYNIIQYNTTELVWRPLQTKFGQGRLTIKNKIKNKTL